VEAARVANLGLRFLLELSALALAVWGFSDGEGVWAWALGLGAPLLAAVLWARFVSPRAAGQVAEPVRLAVEVLIFAAAVAALVALEHPVLALALALVWAANKSALVVLDRRVPA